METELVPAGALAPGDLVLRVELTGTRWREVAAVAPAPDGALCVEFAGDGPCTTPTDRVFRRRVETAGAA